VDRVRGDRLRGAAGVLHLEQHHEAVAGEAERRHEVGRRGDAAEPDRGADHVRLLDVADLARSAAAEPARGRADLHAEVRVEREVSADDAVAIGVLRVRAEEAVRALEEVLDGVRRLVVDGEPEAVAGDEVLERGDRIDRVRGARDREDAERDREGWKQAPGHEGAFSTIRARSNRPRNTRLARDSGDMAGEASRNETSLGGIDAAISNRRRRSSRTRVTGTWHVA
jgi:hypothetical protein